MRSYFTLLIFLVSFTGLSGPLHGQRGGEARKKLVMLISGQSYHAERSLPAFAAQFLEERFRVVIVGGAMDNPENRFDGIEELIDADVLLMSVWRRCPPVEQLDIIRRYIESGRPVVGITTTSHAFARRRGWELREGSADWPEWDAMVIGGNYTGHHPTGPITTVTAADPAHPILAGVALPFRSPMELNKVSPLNPRAHVLLTGSIDGQPPEPVAWTFAHYGKGRTFFTPLGHPEDFAQPAFQRLLLNALRWAAADPD